MTRWEAIAIRTPAEIRLAQAAAIVHGTCLVLAGLMLLAAAEGPRPLLSGVDARLAAWVDVPVGTALMVTSGWLSRGPNSGIAILTTLETLAVVTSPLLRLPLLIVMGIGMSGAVISTMWPRRQVNPSETTNHITAAVRIAQAMGLLHGVCLVIAAGALLGSVRDPHPLISQGDAELDAYVNGPLGAAVAMASLYLARRPRFGRRLLVLTEGGAFVSSVLLHIPLVIGLDMFLSIAVETAILIGNRRARAGEGSDPGMPWPKMPLPWVSATIVIAFVGFAIGGAAATDPIHPDTPLAWIGGVVGATVSGTATACLGHVVAARSARRNCHRAGP